MSDDRPTDSPSPDSSPDTGAERPEDASGASAADPAPASEADAVSPAEADAVSPAGGDQARRPLRTRMLIVIAFVVLAFDLVTKIAVVHFVAPGRPVEIIGDVVTLRLVRNPGAAFSMATGMTWLLTIVAVCVVVAVIRIGRTLRSLWWAIGLGLVLGGALGNLIDRFFRSPGPLQGHVVDFVSVGWWPVFNVADSSIVCGAILLVVVSLLGFEPNGERVSSKKNVANSGAAERK